MAEYIDKLEVGAKIQMMYIRREMDYGGANDFCRGMRKALRIIENAPALQPLNDIQQQIVDFKKSVKSENSDYLTGYLSALSAVEGMIDEALKR